MRNQYSLSETISNTYALIATKLFYKSDEIYKKYSLCNWIEVIINEQDNKYFL